MGRRAVFSSVLVSPDGAHLMINFRDGIHFFDMQTGLPVKQFPHMHGDAVSPDGTLLADESKDGVVLVDVAQGVPVRILSTQYLKRPPGYFRQVAFSPDGTLLAAGSFVGTIVIWRVSDGAVLHEIENREEEIVYSVAFSPDGRSLASACAIGNAPSSFSMNVIMHLDDVSTGKTNRRLKGHSRPIDGMVFSPDGRRIVSQAEWRYDGTINVWDATTGDILRSYELDPMKARISISPDGTLLASAAGRITGIWDMSTAKLLRRLEGYEEDIRKPVFSPDGKWLATWSYDGTVRLWDLPEGGFVREWKDNPSLFLVAFSPVGNLLAVGSKKPETDEYMFSFFDPQDGRRIRTVALQEYFGGDAELSPEGGLLVAGREAYGLWNLSDGSLIRAWGGLHMFHWACSIYAGRQVSGIHYQSRNRDPERVGRRDSEQNSHNVRRYIRIFPGWFLVGDE